MTRSAGHLLVRQRPGSVIPLIAARTEEQFRDNLAASVVSGVYGAQLPDIDDPRAQAVRRTATSTGIRA
jgi:aryl-alcohol dehydrogenase-like predicted oxidoreductase